MELTPEQRAAKESGAGAETTVETPEDKRERVLRELQEGMKGGYVELALIANGDPDALNRLRGQRTAAMQFDKIPDESLMKRPKEMLDSSFVGEWAKVLGGEFGALVAEERGDVEIDPEREKVVAELRERLIEALLDQGEKTIIAKTSTDSFGTLPEDADPVARLLFGRDDGAAMFAPSAARILLRLFKPREPKLVDFNKGTSRDSQNTTSGGEIAVDWTGYRFGNDWALSVGPYESPYYPGELPKGAMYRHR